MFTGNRNKCYYCEKINDIEQSSSDSTTLWCCGTKQINFYYAKIISVQFEKDHEIEIHENKIRYFISSRFQLDSNQMTKFATPQDHLNYLKKLCLLK